MQRPITETFEFFEYMHLIVDNKINLSSKLWLLGNKQMQYLIKNYLKVLTDKNFYSTSMKKSNITTPQKIILLKKFPNIKYLEFTFSKTINIVKFAKYIPKSVKILQLNNHKIEDSELKILPKNVTYLYFNNSYNLKNPIDLPKKLTNLILNDCTNLTTDFLQNLYKITTLELNRLNIVNFELKNLPNLVLLKLEYGKIKTFVLENCLDLKTLDLYGNYLVEFPQSILKLTNLESLRLRWNKIYQIPEEFSQLENLKYLDLGSNKLTEFPTAIFTLLKLETLNLDQNFILEVFILNSKLENLTNLYLSNNLINRIYLDLPKLENLELNSNKIIEINCQTPNLKELYLFGNTFYIDYMVPQSTKIYM